MSSKAIQVFPGKRVFRGFTPEELARAASFDVTAALREAIAERALAAAQAEALEISAVLPEHSSPARLRRRI